MHSMLDSNKYHWIGEELDEKSKNIPKEINSFKMAAPLATALTTKALW